jgi:hypothetical protein
MHFNIHSPTHAVLLHTDAHICQVLATIEAPVGMSTRGEGTLIEARVCRVIRRSGSGETDAVRVSESLPFIEYELQRQLMLKLNVMGLNAVFSIDTQLAVGPSLVIG